MYIYGRQNKCIQYLIIYKKNNTNECRIVSQKIKRLKTHNYCQINRGNFKISKKSLQIFSEKQRKNTTKQLTPDRWH